MLDLPVSANLSALVALVSCMRFDPLERDVGW